MYDLSSKSDVLPTADQAATHVRAGSLLALIERIGETVEAETVAIRSEPGFDIRASNLRKSRQLYELGKTFEALDARDLGAEHRNAIMGLREKLARNEATIQAHLSAVGEVATLLQKAIEKVQADGTYSVREFGQP